MIVTLTGENDYARSREQQALMADFRRDHSDLAIERLDGQEVSLERIQEALASLPFLAARKLVLLREPSTNKQFLEKAEQLFEAITDTTDVIIVEPKLDKRLSYYKLLKKQTDFRDFPHLDESGLATWLTERTKGQKGSLSMNDARYLVQRVGANQQLLANEIEKLLLYNPHITRQTIDELTDASPQSTIFELLEAAFAGKHRTTLELYAEQRAQKVEPPQIIALLAWQLQILAVTKTAGDRSIDTIAKEARLNPFVLRKNQALARRLSQTDITRLTQELLAIDKQVKQSAFDADEALQQYLLQLS